MKSILILPLFLLSVTYIDGADKKPFSSMDVFALEWASNPQISPNGDKIVYQRGKMDIMKDRRTSELWIINTDGTEHMKLTNREVPESGAQWSPDGERIAFTSRTEQGTEIYIYWVKTRHIARITQLDGSPRRLSWSPNGQHIAFSMFIPGSELTLAKSPRKPSGAKWADPVRVITRLKHEADGQGNMRPGFTHIFVIPADGGVARQVTKGNFHHRGVPQWTNDGETLLFTSNRKENWEYDYRNSDIYSVDITNGEIKQLTTRKGPDNSPVISPDGKQIAYLGYDDRVQTYQLTRLYTMSIDGSNQKEYPVNLDRSVRNIQWSPTGEGIYYLFDDKGNTKIGYTPIHGKSVVVAHNIGGTGVARPYGGGSYSIAKNGTIATEQTTPKYPAELTVVRKGEKPNQITQLNSDILPFRKLGEVEEIWYKSSFDGRDVQGWIVKPPYFNPSKKYPLLVENHGGPISNYGDRFSPEMQLYAADGFVVFYPNPRGSTSYGEEFGNLLYHNYPGNDYDDVMSGVDAILKKGYVSEDSLFVTGGSAGGIMSAWMIGKNNRFRSAAVVKPVMNWISKTLSADNYFMYANSRFPGQPWENPETYMAKSPISLVGNITTPTLVMVGEKDLRTPISEAKQLYSGLKIRKVETALVVVPGAFHFISNRPSQMIAKIENILAWFRRYR